MDLSDYSSRNGRDAADARRLDVEVGCSVFLRQLVVDAADLCEFDASGKGGSRTKPSKRSTATCGFTEEELRNP